jgi:hypothetical protein
MMKKILIITAAGLFISCNLYAQSARYQCDENIESLRQDLLSMLNKIPAMPPITQVYTAARSRYDELKRMQDAGDFYTCATESERVLRITKPYGRR